jgi:hypothetical protein
MCDIAVIAGRVCCPAAPATVIVTQNARPKVRIKEIFIMLYARGRYSMD